MPGVRINLSKSGISTSVGPRGAKVTYGPKGTYVNVGVPGTGLYTREKISNGEYKRTSSLIEQNVESTNDSDAVFFVSNQYPYISKQGVLMPLFKSSYYIAYSVALLMPILGLVLYCVPEWWMFFCCLLVDFTSLICWAFVFGGQNGNDCYVEKWNKDNLERVAHKEIKGHKVRCIISIIIALLNCFPFLAMSKDFMRAFEPYIYRNAYEGGMIVMLMTLFVITSWTLNASQENDSAKRWNVLVLPIRKKADNGRNTSVELSFSDIKIGAPVKDYKTEEWRLKDEYENFQSFSVRKQIKVEGVEQVCDCTVLCLNGVIGFLKVTINGYNTKLYSLYYTKYGTPRENVVKDLSEPFSCTWNYANQRVVYQYRVFKQIVDDKDDKYNMLKQVRICYIDNIIYEEIKEFCGVREKKELKLKEKERKEQTLKAEKEREKQKLINEAKESALRKKEIEQI